MNTKKVLFSEETPETGVLHKGETLDGEKFEFEIVPMGDSDEPDFPDFHDNEAADFFWEKPTKNENE